MNCDEFQELFVEYYLSELNPAAQRAVEQHLRSGCTACNREFHALHDGIELLYTIAPQGELPESQRDEVLRNALSSTWTVDHRELPAVGQAVSTAKRGANALSSSNRWMGLLSLVAGFFFVMLLPQSNRSGVVNTAAAERQLTDRLAGERAQTARQLKFVSFKEVAQPVAQSNGPTQLSGFLLVDARAGEIHLLGRVEQAEPTVVPQIALRIVTANEEIVHPLTFAADGSCKALVPLPQEPILRIELQEQATAGTEVVPQVPAGRVF